MREIVLNDVPKNRVGTVAQSFVDNDNATKVVVEKQSRNDNQELYDITGTVP